MMEKRMILSKPLSSLKVNLLIKQSHWNRKYSNIIQNIIEMRNLHEGKFDNVYYIEPEESIMTALAMSGPRCIR